MTRPLAAADVGARECGCPEQVIRCVHWSGRLLIMCDATNLDVPHRLVRFDAAITDDLPPDECECGCGWRHWRNGKGNSIGLYSGGNRAAAEAAFWEAERELREEVRE